jgi:(1->4)-alpha-D-glucan 1-alpha-D-glucosylmutase
MTQPEKNAGAVGLDVKELAHKETASLDAHGLMEPVYILTAVPDPQSQEATQSVRLRLPKGTQGFRWRLSGEHEEQQFAEHAVDQRNVAALSADRSKEQSASARGEDGPAKAGAEDLVAYSFALPPLSTGNYTLRVQITDREDAIEHRSHLIVAPLQGFLPESASARMWGPFVRVASLRSSRNWGVGDFSDLSDVCSRSLENVNAGIIVVEPLQPVVSDDVREQSQIVYSSLSFIDPVYIDVESVSGFDACDEAKRTVLAPDFQERLAHLRDVGQVDFACARELKVKALTMLYHRFRQQHVRSDSRYAQEFYQFQQEGAEPLRQFSAHQALAEHLKEADFRRWPSQYRDPLGEAVVEFVEANLERVEFFQYLQWIAANQLQSIGRACAAGETQLGLCATVPFAVDPAGFESWRHQSLVEAGVLSGAHAAGGASLGAYEAAVIPHKLRELGYRPYIEALQAAGRYCAGIYVADISAFERRIWSSEANNEFIAVDYPFNELIATLKMESHRSRCVVIAAGFDRLSRVERGSEHDVPQRLGIIPVVPIFSHDTEVFGDQQSAFPIPSAVLPAGSYNSSFVSFWLGADVHIAGLDASVGKPARDSAVAQRVLERVDVLRKLEQHDLLPANISVDPASASVLALSVSAAFYQMLCSEPATILLVPLEDLAGRHVVDKVVTPYSYAEKLTIPTPEIYTRDSLSDLVSALKRYNRRSHRDATQASELSLEVRATIPRVTYRMQFHKDFSLTDADDLIPYLEALGVSHVYSSPLLGARSGSMHGYDIVNHKHLNSEIGANTDLTALTDHLKQRGMGIVMDMVPNHMGIGKENPWWMDVLENGPASQFAEYFDIDWAPIKPELRGKVTIPVLGEFYGSILHSGQLKLQFYPERGSLVLRYYENEYPLNPLTYPMVLGERLEVLKERLGSDNLDVMEFLSVITAFKHLPGHMDPDGRTERIREKQLQMRRLAELCKRNPTIAEFISQNLKHFDVQNNDRHALQRLHTLLEKQAYRLVHWRVANDEINYRRFFDVNDLAAVRTEDPRVFSEMHELVLRWVQERKIDGLRIDHPDGLFDPSSYFQELQRDAAARVGASWDRKTSVGGKVDLPFYIIVEKILAPFERLEENWAVQGTTGYDFLNEVLGVLVRPESEEQFTLIYETVVGRSFDYDELKRECKKTILDSVLASELNVLAHRLSQIAESSWYFRDLTLNSLRYALRQIVIAFPVYRTYVTPQNVDKSARQFIDWAIGKAKRISAASSTAVYDFIRSVLLLEASASPIEQDTEENSDFKRAIQTFAMKFQQFTGPVMAKSFEDTLFYRYVRFAGLNEVGGEPERFGSTLANFHQKNSQRQQRHPYSMLSTSTHDTKRSEDVRTRLAALSELPMLWEQRVIYWTRVNRSKKTIADDETFPDANDEYLLYQTIVGACPFTLSTEEEVASFCKRIQQYMLKAVREAKRFTSWVNQNAEYETALNNFIERIFAPSSANPFLDDLKQFCYALAPLGLLNGLVQTVLKLTCPGVPDIYQGTELWDFTLVDPDNRRPIDYALRRKLLEEMEPHLNDVECAKHNEERSRFVADILKNINDGRIKMYVIAMILRLRRAQPDLFTDGRYIPLEVTGPAAEHVLAFARERGGTWAIVVVPHLVASLLQLDAAERLAPIDPSTAVRGQDVWQETAITLPGQLANKRLANLFTCENVATSGGQLLLSNVFDTLPVSVILAS